METFDASSLLDGQPKGEKLVTAMLWFSTPLEKLLDGYLKTELLFQSYEYFQECENFSPQFYLSPDHKWYQPWFKVFARSKLA